MDRIIEASDTEALRAVEGEGRELMLRLQSETTARRRAQARNWAMVAIIALLGGPAAAGLMEPSDFERRMEAAETEVMRAQADAISWRALAESNAEDDAESGLLSFMANTTSGSLAIGGVDLATPSVLSIGHFAGAPVVTIRQDGRVRINPRLSMAEAASAFWLAVERSNPMRADVARLDHELEVCRIENHIRCYIGRDYGECP